MKARDVMTGPAITLRPGVEVDQHPTRDQCNRPVVPQHVKPPELPLGKNRTMLDRVRATRKCLWFRPRNRCEPPGMRLPRQGRRTLASTRYAPEPVVARLGRRVDVAGSIHFGIHFVSGPD